MERCAEDLDVLNADFRGHEVTALACGYGDTVFVGTARGFVIRCVGPLSIETAGRGMGIGLNRTLELASTPDFTCS